MKPSKTRDQHTEQQFSWPRPHPEGTRISHSAQPRHTQRQTPRIHKTTITATIDAPFATSHPPSYSPRSLVSLDEAGFQKRWRRASRGRASLTSAPRGPRSFAAAPTFWDFCHEYFITRISLARQSSRPDRVHKPWSRGLLAACVDISNWMGQPPVPTCTGFSRSSFRSRVTVCPVHGLPTSSMCVLRLPCVEFPVLWKSAKGFHPGTQKKISDKGP